MKVILKRLEYKNFKSVGNVPIVIDLNTHKSTLISGSNGSGKSTVISALCFGLFGRGYGTITKSALINSINQKQLLVTVEFDIGKKQYKVVRGIKPNIFEIYEGGNLVNQDPNVRDYQKILEQQILKFNYRAFTQVVTVGGGSDYTPFMKLSAKDRREFVEDLLDIRIFSTMNLLNKEDVKATKEAVRDVDVSIKVTAEKITSLNDFIKKMKQNKSDESDKIVSHIESLTATNDELREKISQLDAVIALMAGKVAEHKDLTFKLSEVRGQVKSLVSRIAKLHTKAKEYDELLTCPTCSQTLTDEYKKNVLDEYHNDIAATDSAAKKLTERETTMSELLAGYSSHLEDYSKALEELSELNSEIYANSRSIRNYNDQLEDIQSNTGSIDAELKTLKLHAREYKALDGKKATLIETQECNEFIQKSLSDSGIKSKIIKQYIPTINRLINKYLADLDFFVSFHLDEEFNETIRSRFRDNFTYEHFSEGQKRRIDLAILLTWMEIAKAKNALHLNVAFMDEIDAPLDAEGGENLNALLRTASPDHIFLVSHKVDLLSDKVDEVIKFEIKNNFTERVYT